MVALSVSERDVEAYEQCRSVFSSQPGDFCSEQIPVSGMVIMLQKGFFAWLQYRNTEKPRYPLKDMPLKYLDTDMQTEELVILLATLLGGNIYESEF